jgi:hypothetical protein
VQADTRRRQADLPAAIATRRRLISEHADVRPRNRPDLVFDHRLLLAEDLFSDGQVSEAAVALSELLTALRDTEVSEPRRRLPDAMRLRVLTLWRLELRAQSLALNDELQARFAPAEEARARNVAADTLVWLIARYMYERSVPPAITLAWEVRARFSAETDSDALTFLGSELEATASRYALPVWTAALLGTTIPLGPGPEGNRTRAAIHTILRTDPPHPALRRFVESQLRAMDKRAPSELSGEAPRGRVRGWSSRRSRGRG